MPAIEIPQKEWPEFLHVFAQQHTGWLMRVEVRDREGHATPLLEPRPLARIHSGQETIQVVLGSDDGVQQTESIDSPLRMRFIELESGAHVGLDIESRTGNTVVLRFRSPMLPEMLNGLAA